MTVHVPTPDVTWSDVQARLARVMARLAEIDADHDDRAARVAQALEGARGVVENHDPGDG